MVPEMDSRVIGDQPASVGGEGVSSRVQHVPRCTSEGVHVQTSASSLEVCSRWGRTHPHERGSSAPATPAAGPQADGGVLSYSKSGKNPKSAALMPMPHAVLNVVVDAIGGVDDQGRLVVAKHRRNLVRGVRRSRRSGRWCPRRPRCRLPQSTCTRRRSFQPRQARKRPRRRRCRRRPHPRCSCRSRVATQAWCQRNHKHLQGCSIAHAAPVEHAVTRDDHFATGEVKTVEGPHPHPRRKSAFSVPDKSPVHLSHQPTSVGEGVGRSVEHMLEAP